MNKKHLLFLLVGCLVGILAIASASASDLNETNILEEDSSNLVGENLVCFSEDDSGELSPGDEKLSVTEDSYMLSTNYNPVNSIEIQSCVDVAKNGDTIVLDGYYLLNNTINVGKQLSFIGKNNAVIDGNKCVQLFSVTGNNVIFKDITFKNGNTTGNGGAINGVCSAINCNFIDNVATDGGAMYLGSVINCTFINNTATYRGGAVYDVNASNCNFSNNTANYGGAIFEMSKQYFAEDCIFIGNSAVYCGAVNGNALNCTFINNTATRFGGAFSYGLAMNCTFTNNTASSGGAVYEADIVNCTFIDNHASDSGGAYYGVSSSVNSDKIVFCIFIGNTAIRYGGAMCNGLAVNCTFINNTANKYGGGAIAFGSASNSIFINNSAEGTYYRGTINSGNAVNCSFINNHGSAMSSAGSYSTYSAINCTFINNTDSGSGGALKGISAVNCTFIGNSANRGGAMSEGSAVNCTFVNNSASEYGGAIANSNNALNCTFEGNFALNGGASYNSDLINCTLVNNHAGDYGGASYNSNVLNCIFENNYAKNGGAISGRDYNATNCNFTNNVAENGGAAYQSLVINCIFSKNNATLNGGSIYDGFASNCIFINNHADFDGGAAYKGVVANSIFEYNSANNDGGAANSLKATKCTFNNNQAGNYGGAVSNSEYSSNSNFNNNVAKIGNDVYNSSSFELMNTLTDLNSLINDNNFSDIYLNENYIFDYSLDYNFREGIPINRSVTIHGNNLRIDGNNLSRIFNVTNDGAVFKDIYFVNCNVNTYGGVINGVCTAINCTFENNTANLGGVLYKGSAVNCTFINNNANSAGAIYEGSAVRCIFVGNSATDDCGAMYKGSAVNCTFVNNSASSSAGAIKYTSSFNCIFVNNSAYLGGAKCFGNDTVNCTFVNNHAYRGGAIYGSITGYGIRFKLENCTFINNTAEVDGGAVYYYEVFNSNFINNSAKNGGAIKTCHATKCNFTGNSADNGGAVYGGSATDCIFINNSASEYGSCLSNCNGVNCTFINNSASSNGVAYSSTVENCTFSNHNNYAIYSSNAKNCLFVNNFGAMYGGSALNCTFINNSASKGGAINGGSSSSVVNCIFINNSASEYGGAIYYCDSAMNCTFINNSASENGGAMYYTGSAMNCTFINNSAEYGGATYEVVNILNSTFINNTATKNGGAIKGSYYGGGPPSLHLALVENCTFINNSAEYGGAITDADTVVNCTFINNSAILGGSLYGTYDVYQYFYYSGGSSFIGTFYTKVYNCTFINGSATYGGAMYDGNASNCSFINNSADYGGAIYLENNMTIIYCDFINCYVDKLGGAIYLNQSANIIYCTFKNCLSGEDSSSLAVNSSQSNYTISQCIFDEYPYNINYHYISSLIADNLTYFNGEEGLLVANLYDIRGAITNRIVTITIGSKKYNATTDSNGLAHFNIDSYLNKAGIYNATVSFEGDHILYSASANVTLTINRHIAILNATDLILYKNEYGTLIVNLSNIRGPLNGKKIIFSVNSVTRTITTDNNGVAEFDVINYVDSKGEYAVNITFEGDDYNYPVSTNVRFIYVDYEGMLTGSVDGKYFNDTILTFNLINNRTNKPVSNAPVMLVFSNGVIVNLTTDVDGNVEYRMSLPFVPDYYDVTARVVGEYVNVNEVTINEIQIKKIFGVIEHTLLNGNKTLRFKLSSRFNSDVFRNVKIDLLFNNGETAEIITDENGIASYDIPFPKGVYSVSVSVKGEYKDFEDDYIGNIVVSNDLNCSINFTNNISFAFGDYGSTNYVVDGGIVELDHIKVVDHPEALISLSNTTITVFGLSVGKYVLEVETTPDDYHNPVIGRVNITVTNAPSKVRFSAGIVFEYGSSSSIHVIVEGGKVERKNIKIVGHPEANIQFKGNVITVSGLAVGNYNLQVTSTPDSDHRASTATVRVTVKKATAVIKASKITVAYKKGGQWVIKFIDSKSKKAISNMKVTLKVYTGKKYKTVSLKTNSKGEATYQTKKLSKGNHKVVVSAKDSRYNFNSYSSSIKVVKQTAVKFKVKKKTAKDGAALSITVMNKKTKKGIKGVKINLLIYTGKKYKTVTLKSMKKGKYVGVCGYATNKLSVGKHKVKIMPADIKYGGSAKSVMKITKKHKKIPAWETKDSAK